MASWEPLSGLVDRLHRRVKTLPSLPESRRADVEASSLRHPAGVPGRTPGNGTWGGADVEASSRGDQ